MGSDGADQSSKQPQRVLIEPRGSRRLSSTTLLDLRVSRTIALGGMGQAELLLDVLNALNDTAEQSIASDVWSAPASVGDDLHGSASRDGRREVPAGPIALREASIFSADRSGGYRSSLGHGRRRCAYRRA